MLNNAKQEIPYEIFMMNPKNEPEIRAPQTDALQQQAFSAEADARNGEFAQNTTARD